MFKEEVIQNSLIKLFSNITLKHIYFAIKEILDQVVTIAKKL